ncbi:MAG: S8 family serine peptidase [Bacteroidetes bacterium]|nr:S8 family serine peptidase [Bacteroidota bacterium]
MKRFALMTGLLCLFQSAFAQSPDDFGRIGEHTNIQRLKVLSDSFASRYFQNRDIASALATKNKWPLMIPQEGGGMKALVGITDDSLPLYAQTLNRGAGITLRTDKLYSGGGLGLAVHGEGMIAGLWDVSGILRSHEAFGNRVSQMDPMYTSVTANHSTHVAGTIIASDLPQNGNIRGMAFKARLHAYDWYNDLSETANAAANGLLISCHPYSMAPQPITYWGTYIARTASWDQIMYNAPYYLVVWAGGNGGPYTDRLTNEAANKNGIAVASVFQLNEYTGPSSVQISSFSSRGPARDGRIKPDICAKGESVLSCNFNSNNTTYSYGWGTSMASASATGTLLLLQQHYRNRTGRFMRSATLKALAIHTADEAGASPGPDIAYGWGLLNAQRAAELISNGVSTVNISENTLTNGQVYVKTVTANGNSPLTVTICWTDPAGIAVANPADLSSRLVNDLDIRINGCNQTWFPWKLDPGNITGPAIQGDNTLDNLEKIEIPDPVPGQTYTITISHKSVLQSTGVQQKQDYSLLVSGEAACQAERTISGYFSEPNFRSASWIRSAGSVVMNPNVPITLIADPVDGFIELAPQYAQDSIYIAPLAGSFTTEWMQGCTDASLNGLYTTNTKVSEYASKQTGKNSYGTNQSSFRQWRKRIRAAWYTGLSICKVL